MKIVNSLVSMFLSDEDKIKKVKELSDEMELILAEKDFLSENYTELQKALQCDEFTCKENVLRGFKDEVAYLNKLASLKTKENKVSGKLSFYKSLEVVKEHELNEMIHSANKLMKSLYRGGKLTLEEYGKVLGEKTEKGQVKYADIIVLNSSGELLLLKRSEWEDKHKGAWVIPGGHVDKGEDCEQAAKRELLEESGISIDKLIYENKIFQSQWMKLGVVENEKAHVSYYCLNGVNTSDIEILLDDAESRDYLWMKREEIDNYPMVFDMQKNIKELLGWEDVPNLHIIRKAVEQGIIPINRVNDIVKALNHKYIDKKIGPDGKFIYFYPTEDKLGVNTKENDYDRIRKYSQEVIEGTRNIERLSPAEEQGRIRGGRTNVEATEILRGNEITDSTEPERIDNLISKQESLLTEYAKENNKWFEPSDIQNNHDFYGGGEEASVFRLNDVELLKVYDYRLFSVSPLEFIDNRISLHNFIFPCTPYELLGFTDIPGRGFCFVLKQPYISDSKNTPIESIKEELSKMGFKDMGGNSYYNENYIIDDLHHKNVLTDKNGILHFIDTVPYLNEIDEGYGGVRKYGEFGDIEKSEVNDIEKAKDLSKLAKIKKLVSKDGKVFLQTFYVKTGEREEKELPEEKGYVSVTPMELEVGSEISVSTSKKKANGRLIDITFDKTTNDWYLLTETKDGKTVWSKFSAILNLEIVPKKEAEDILTDTLKDALEIRSLGGSSDVKFMIDYKGRDIVVKKERDRDDGAKQLVDEVVADNIYRLMGIPVPESRLIEEGGKTYKVSKYISGKELGALHRDETGEAYKELKKGFVLDCFLANWDVIGANGDNILVSDGIPYRVDNGSSLRFRARGAGKGSTLTPEVTELKTMLDPGKNPSSEKVFRGITDEEINKQINDLLDKKDSILNEIVKLNDSDLFNTMALRFSYLRKLVPGDKMKVTDTGEETVKEAKKEKRDDMPSLTTQNYFDNGWDELVLEGNKGIKEAIKKQILATEKINDSEYLRHARDMGITIEQYKERMQIAVEKAIQKSEFFRATHCNSYNVKYGRTVNAFDYVMNKDKRFKSQFETSKSDGSLDKHSRALTEHAFFGFSKETYVDTELRPIYGYFSTDRNNGIINAAGTIPPSNFVENYGEVNVKIKRDAAMRKATVCFTDSLGMSFNYACTPASKPHFTSLGSTSLKDIEKRLSENDGVSLAKFSYVEAQYHNQLTTEDIESIHISNRVYGEGKESFDDLNTTIGFVTDFIARSGNDKIKLKVY